MTKKYRFRKEQEGAGRIWFFHGSYDVPLKANDKERLWESEEVYQFIICAICPLVGEYEPGEPECGFLFPAFTDRSSDIHRIAVFQKDAVRPHSELEAEILCLEAKKEFKRLDHSLLTASGDKKASRNPESL